MTNRTVTISEADQRAALKRLLSSDLYGVGSHLRAARRRPQPGGGDGGLNRLWREIVLGT